MVPSRPERQPTGSQAHLLPPERHRCFSSHFRLRIRFRIRPIIPPRPGPAPLRGYPAAQRRPRSRAGEVQAGDRREPHRIVPRLPGFRAGMALQAPQRQWQCGRERREHSAHRKYEWAYRELWTGECGVQREQSGSEPAGPQLGVRVVKKRFEDQREPYINSLPLPLCLSFFARTIRTHTKLTMASCTVHLSWIRESPIPKRRRKDIEMAIAA